MAWHWRGNKPLSEPMMAQCFGLEELKIPCISSWLKVTGRPLITGFKSNGFELRPPTLRHHHSQLSLIWFFSNELIIIYEQSGVKYNTVYHQIKHLASSRNILTLITQDLYTQPGSGKLSFGHSLSSVGNWVMQSNKFCLTKILICHVR